MSDTISIIAISLLCIFAIILLNMYLGAIVFFLLNAIIVFLIALRTFSDLRKGKNLTNYLIAAGISAILLILFKNFISVFWPITTFLVLTILLKPLSPKIKKLAKK